MTNKQASHYEFELLNIVVEDMQQNYGKVDCLQASLVAFAEKIKPHDSISHVSYFLYLNDIQSLIGFSNKGYKIKVMTEGYEISQSTLNKMYSEYGFALKSVKHFVLVEDAYADFDCGNFYSNIEIK